MNSRKTTPKPTPSQQSSSSLQTPNTMDPLEYRELYELFATFDRDGNGVISIDEWREAMRRWGHQATEEEVLEMLKEHNLQSKNQMTLIEFIEIITKKQQLMRGEEHTELVNAFRIFDEDLNGTLSAAELKAGLERAGESMRLQDLELLVVMADKDHDGAINFEEFCKIMTLK